MLYSTSILNLCQECRHKKFKYLCNRLGRNRTRDSSLFYYLDILVLTQAYNVTCIFFYNFHRLLALLYFDINTIWYLHFHFVCANVLLSIRILPPLIFLLRLAKPASFYQFEVVFSAHSYKLFGIIPLAGGIPSYNKELIIL